MRVKESLVIKGVIAIVILIFVHHELFGIIFFFQFYFIFKLYNIVFVLPNIEMNLPQVYLCSPVLWPLLSFPNLLTY